MADYDRPRRCVIDLTTFYHQVMRVFDRFELEIGRRQPRYVALAKAIATSVVDRSACSYIGVIMDTFSARMRMDLILLAQDLETVIREWFACEGVDLTIIALRLPDDGLSLVYEFESVYDDEQILFEEYINHLIRSGEPVHSEITRAIRQFRSLHARTVPLLQLGYPPARFVRS